MHKLLFEFLEIEFKGLVYKPVILPDTELVGRKLIFNKQRKKFFEIFLSLWLLNE